MDFNYTGLGEDMSLTGDPIFAGAFLAGLVILVLDVGSTVNRTLASIVDAKFDRLFYRIGDQAYLNLMAIPLAAGIAGGCWGVAMDTIFNHWPGLGPADAQWRRGEWIALTAFLISTVPLVLYVAVQRDRSRTIAARVNSLIREPDLAKRSILLTDIDKELAKVPVAAAKAGVKWPVLWVLAIFLCASYAVFSSTRVVFLILFAAALAAFAPIVRYRLLPHSYLILRRVLEEYRGEVERALPAPEPLPVQEVHHHHHYVEGRTAPVGVLLGTATMAAAATWLIMRRDPWRQRLTR